MCGIAGRITLSSPIDTTELQFVGNTLQHRGPDDQGVYISSDGKTGLAHRRLSLIDITSAGHQPMRTSDGRLSITYNGEIYNYIEIRETLKKAGYSFVTTSDTEVILLGYLHWGKAVVNQLKGMFAFAILDEQEHRLFLARDRFGIKPLYIATQGGNFYFGSEVKAIISWKSFDRRIRHTSISTFLANRYVSDNYTMWEDIRKLGAGCIMEVDVHSLKQKTETYWKLSAEVDRKADKDIQGRFDQLLEHSLAEHLRSDVPVGAFLSGGMDSSALVALMRSRLNYPTSAFSIGFSNWGESEDKYAKLVADHVGADLHSLRLDRIDLHVVKKLMHYYDDPIADISILPTYAVCGLASGQVKAVVSGEGSDELLGGYWWHRPDKFHITGTLNRWLSNVAGIRKSQIKSHYIEAMSMGLYDRKQLLAALGPELHGTIPDDPFSHYDALLDNKLPVLKQLQYLDIHSFMGELILTKVDRASMAHSLEVRVPFLDHELVEYLFSQPEEGYFTPGVQKPLLQHLLKDLVPGEILKRPKQGFVGPDDFYKDFSLYRDTLANGELVKGGLIQNNYIEELLSQQDHWRLWKLFVLESWWQEWAR